MDARYTRCPVIKGRETLASFVCMDLGPPSFLCHPSAAWGGAYREADLATTHDVIQESVHFFHLAEGQG